MSRAERLRTRLEQQSELRHDLAQFDHERPCEASRRINRPLLRRLVGFVFDDPTKIPCPRPATWMISLHKPCDCNPVRVGLLCEFHYEYFVTEGLQCDRCGTDMAITYAERIG